jgi:uncharacterized protein
VTVTAAPDLQLRLLDLQALDARLDLLAHKRRSLPEHAEIAELDARLTDLGDRLIAVDAEISDHSRAVRKAESDVEQVRARAERDNRLLLSGTVTSAKHLEDLQGELASLARRQAELEDVELEAMERLEEAQTARAALVADRDAASASRDAAVTRRDAATTAIGTEQQQLSIDRADVVAVLPPDLLALYTKLRADHDGVGAAALHRGRCQGCHMELTPIDLGRIRSAAPDSVLRCDQCRRILVRAPESGL